MLRPCRKSDFFEVYTVINAAAIAYRGVIPSDRWKEPYMPENELKAEITAGVDFWCLEKEGSILGVMGIQDVRDVTLIRHAYTIPTMQRKGVGSELLRHLSSQTEKPLLIGTWAKAEWAVRFYQKHEFALVSEEEKNILLRKYWQIPARQVETSVVLSNSPVKKLVAENKNDAAGT
ncbi:MAG: GNAT family N-acetyltransferase [Desulfobulbales bacterium]|nr:GNAT family N-acetyltransferase [Desulfobulbales bacterium]